MKSILLFLAGVLVGANVVYFLLVRPAVAPALDPGAPSIGAPPIATQPGGSPTTPTGGTASPPDATRSPAVGPGASAASAPAAGGNAAAPPGMAPGGVSSALIVPVSGVLPSQLDDTFNDARGSERRHEALDIMAPRGTPVLATADGTVEKLFDSKQGGLTIYEFDAAGTRAYYYAHLDRYAPGLAEGKQLRRGEVIGYVGSTGNASPDAPHLHFAIFLLGPEKQWWKGRPINPYPLLTRKR